jgi:cytochrome c553
MERQELHQAIDDLPDDDIDKLAPYIALLRRERDWKPNNETIAAIEELRAGKGKKFTSIEELMDDLDNENDD